MFYIKFVCRDKDLDLDCEEVYAFKEFNKEFFDSHFKHLAWERANIYVGVASAFEDSAFKDEKELEAYYDWVVENSKWFEVTKEDYEKHLEDVKKRTLELEEWAKEAFDN